MREEQHVDAPHRNAELVEPHGCTTAGVDQQRLIAGFDQRAGAEAVGPGNRCPCPDQRYPEIV